MLVLVTQSLTPELIISARHFNHDNFSDLPLARKEAMDLN